MKNARVLCMDEVSTGLDASVTFNIISGLKAWAQRTQGTCIIALLQPTTEVVSLFDDVLLLKEGDAPVYHGPMESVASHFKSLQNPTCSQLWRRSRGLAHLSARLPRRRSHRRALCSHQKFQPKLTT